MTQAMRGDHRKLGSDVYIPGEAVSAETLGLHTNELPFEPPPSVHDAIVEASGSIRRYPDPQALQLRVALAEYHHVNPENILVGAGGDGLLDALFRARVRSGDLVQLTDPTYIVLRQLCRVYGAEVRTVSWPAFPLLNTAAAALTFVVNPNSPTGLWTPPAQLASELPEVSGLLVIDEAYAPFTSQSMIPALVGHPNWVVVRSFSKAYALAGLRIGYMIAEPEVVENVAQSQLPYPTSSVALAAARAALQEEDHLERVIAHVTHERARLASAFTDYGWDPGASQGNFLWVRPPLGDAESWREWFLSQGVAVRWFPQIDRERLRVTISTRRNNEMVASLIAGRRPVGTT